jgi:hypothetical protein
MVQGEGALVAAYLAALLIRSALFRQPPIKGCINTILSCRHRQPILSAKCAAGNRDIIIAAYRCGGSSYTWSVPDSSGLWVVETTSRI